MNDDFNNSNNGFTTGFLGDKPRRSNTKKNFDLDSISNTQQMNFNNTNQMPMSVTDVQNVSTQPLPIFNNMEQIHANKSVPDTGFSLKEADAFNNQMEHTAAHDFSGAIHSGIAPEMPMLNNQMANTQSFPVSNIMGNTSNMPIMNTQPIPMQDNPFNNTQNIPVQNPPFSNTQNIPVQNPQFGNTLNNQLNNTRDLPMFKNNVGNNMNNTMPLPKLANNVPKPNGITNKDMPKEKVNVSKILNISSIVLMIGLIVFVVLYVTGAISFKKDPETKTPEVVVDPEEEKITRMVGLLNNACNNLDSQGNYGKEPELEDKTCTVITCFIVNNPICAGGLCMVSDSTTVYSKDCNTGRTNKVNANDFQANVNLGDACSIIMSDPETTGDLAVSYATCVNFECVTTVGDKTYSATCKKDS